MGSPLQNIDQNIISSVQNLVTCGNKVTSIPSHYAYFKNPSDSAALPGDGIPVIDYSLLISEDHDQQTKTVSELGKACRDWGFFMVWMLSTSSFFCISCMAHIYSWQNHFTFFISNFIGSFWVSKIYNYCWLNDRWKTMAYRRNYMKLCLRNVKSLIQCQMMKNKSLTWRRMSWTGLSLGVAIIYPLLE